jgi:hypothetical protein
MSLLTASPTSTSFKAILRLTIYQPLPWPRGGTTSLATLGNFPGTPSETPLKTEHA